MNARYTALAELLTLVADKLDDGRRDRNGFMDGHAGELRLLADSIKYSEVSNPDFILSPFFPTRGFSDLGCLLLSCTQRILGNMEQERSGGGEPVGGEPERLPFETLTCRLCNGEPREPWPPVVGGGPTHHTCHPGEERRTLRGEENDQ